MGKTQAKTSRWKSFERAFARFEHTIPSGHAKLDEERKPTHSDTQNLSIYGEAKYRLTSKICGWLMENAARAKREKKVPVMGFKSYNIEGFVWATLSRFWQNVPIFWPSGNYAGRILMLKKEGVFNPRKFYRGIVVRCGVKDILDPKDNTTWIIEVDEYKPKMLTGGE